MENNFAAEDVVAKAVLALPDAPLAFAWLQACQLFDWMAAGAPMRIFSEDDNQFFKSIKQIIVSSR